MLPREIAGNYQRALDYLDGCADFGETELREANRLAGSPLREADILQMLSGGPLVLSREGKPGGMNFVKAQMRESLLEGIGVFDSLKGVGEPRKTGCFKLFALVFCLPVAHQAWLAIAELMR